MCSELATVLIVCMRAYCERFNWYDGFTLYCDLLSSSKLPPSQPIEHGDAVVRPNLEKVKSQTDREESLATEQDSLWAVVG
jgi:hypothetical protein